MTQQEALEVIVPHRSDRIVVTTMSAIGTWSRLSDSPLDFHYIPSAMGHAPDLGLGLALAQPGRGVIVLNGDGCMLMNLGVLVTIANHPADLHLVIVVNGHYEVTGGQPIAGEARTDFAALARAAGIRRTYAFTDLAAWRAGAAEALTGGGPVVIALTVAGKLGQRTPTPPRPLLEQIRRFRQALNAV